MSIYTNVVGILNVVKVLPLWSEFLTQRILVLVTSLPFLTCYRQRRVDTEFFGHLSIKKIKRQKILVKELEVLFLPSTYSRP